MVDKVDKLYQAWYRLWKDAVVPKLIRQPKWFKTDKHLKPGDLVYFEKDPSKLSSVWIMGRVDQIIRSADGLIREAKVAYRNHKESFNRLTGRRLPNRDVDECQFRLVRNLLRRKMQGRIQVTL